MAWGEELLEEIEDLFSDLRIGRRRDENTLRVFRHTYHVPTGRRVGNAKGNYYKSAQRSEALILLATGLSARAVAKLVGVSNTAVSKWKNQRTG